MNKIDLSVLHEPRFAGSSRSGIAGFLLLIVWIQFPTPLCLSANSLLIECRVVEKIDSTDSGGSSNERKLLVELDTENFKIQRTYDNSLGDRYGGPLRITNITTANKDAVVSLVGENIVFRRTEHSEQLGLIGTTDENIAFLALRSDQIFSEGDVKRRLSIPWVSPGHAVSIISMADYVRYGTENDAGIRGKIIVDESLFSGWR